MDGLIVDAGSWAQWASAGAALIAVAISGVSYVRGARKQEMQVAHDRITDVKERQAGHADRIARIEADMQHLPSKEQVGKMETQLAYLRGASDTMNAKVDAQGERTARIENSVSMLVENELRERKK